MVPTRIEVSQKVLDHPQEIIFASLRLRDFAFFPAIIAIGSIGDSAKLPVNSMGADQTNLMARLDRLQMLVVTGKGGVGKSTVTAALGAHLANRGRKVLLIEVDPRENLHQLLDTPPSGGEIVEAASRLWLQHLEPRRLLDDLVREKLKVGALVRKVLASPVHLHFTEGAPGLKQTAVFGRALRMVEGYGPKELRRPDVVILDAPASGHGIAWMAAPQLVSEVISSGPIGNMASRDRVLSGRPGSIRFSHRHHRRGNAGAGGVGAPRGDVDAARPSARAGGRQLGLSAGAEAARQGRRCDPSVDPATTGQRGGAGPPGRRMGWADRRDTARADRCRAGARGCGRRAPERLVRGP